MLKTITPALRVKGQGVIMKDIYIPNKFIIANPNCGIVFDKKKNKNRLVSDILNPNYNLTDPIHVGSVDISKSPTVILSLNWVFKILKSKSPDRFKLLTYMDIIKSKGDVPCCLCSKCVQSAKTNSIFMATLAFLIVTITAGICLS